MIKHPQLSEHPYKFKKLVFSKPYFHSFYTNQLNDTKCVQGHCPLV